MKFTLIICLCYISLLFLNQPSAFADEKLFKRLKCTKCHSINSLGIERVKKKDEDTAGKKKKKYHDLSEAGKYHDAAFYSKYLRKKEKHVPHEGLDSTKKHKKKFKGNDKEFEKIIEWLLTLK